MKQSAPAESERQQNDPQQRKQSDASVVSVAFVDNRESTAQMRQLMMAMKNSPQAIAQRQLNEEIHNSPRMIAQRQQMAAITGDAVQRVEGEEELLQGQFKPVQRVEEDELLQGKLDVTQRIEDEETLQGKFEPVQRVEDDELMQGKFDAVQRVEDEELLQGKFSTAQLEQAPAEKQNNTGLPDNLKSGIENLSGMSMDHVKVHYNSSEPAQLNAHAYAQGTDIHVAPRQEQHLPHEAWHVVQQAQGRVRPTMQMKDGIGVNDNQGLEREADLMGARAVAAGVVQAKQEMNNAIESDAINGSVQISQPIVQRRIGFELETGIPLAEQVPGGGGPAYRALDNDDLEAPFPGGKLMVDHLPGHAVSVLENYNHWNIVEFVTDPIDDRMSEANFRNMATVWIQNLQAVEAYAQGNHGLVQNAPNVGAPGTGLNIHIGVPVGGDAAVHWNRFAPQATMGIKLKKIGSILANETQAGGYPGHVRHDRVSLGAQPANATANTIMNDVHAMYPMNFHTKRSGWGEMQGLIVLLCNYLLTGAANAGRGGYRKNFTTMMYKSMLSSVRNDIIGKTYPGEMLTDPARRTNIRNMILHQTNVAVGDEVFDGIEFNGNPVYAGAWINSVLAGGTDLVFLAMKNPWSNEIGPENVHGKSAAVMEMRDTSDFGMSAMGIAGLNDTANIINYLTQVYLRNKGWSR